MNFKASTLLLVAGLSFSIVSASAQKKTTTTSTVVTKKITVKHVKRPKTTKGTDSTSKYLANLPKVTTIVASSKNPNKPIPDITGMNIIKVYNSTEFFAWCDTSGYKNAHTAIYLKPKETTTFYLSKKNAKVTCMQTSNTDDVRDINTWDFNLTQYKSDDKQEFDLIMQ